MLSSLQILNLSGNLQEDDLQHLQLFTEYGRLALMESDKKPFQRLLFLVRDWSFPNDNSFGPIGGKELLENCLHTTDSSHSEQISVRDHIKTCFTDVDCFLMPHPGQGITKKNFNGCLNDLADDFKIHLSEFILNVLSPEKLVCKEIGGQRVKASQFIQYFKTYINIFSGEKLPEPMTVLMATAEANHQVAANEAEASYNRKMVEILEDPDTLHMSDEKFDALHEKYVLAAVEQFEAQPKMGGDNYRKKFDEKLKSGLNKLKKIYKTLNDHKLDLAKVNHLTAQSEAVKIFFEFLDKICNENSPYLKPDEFEQEYQRYKDHVLVKFDKQKKIGGEKIFQEYRSMLIADIDKKKKNYSDQNKLKLSAAEARYHSLFMDAKRNYSKEMDRALNNELQPDELRADHERVKGKLLKDFEVQLKNGFEEPFNKVRKLLVDDIECQFVSYEKLCTGKAKHLQRLYINAKNKYTECMDEITENGSMYVFPNILEREHTKRMNAAMAEFDAEDDKGIQHANLSKKLQEDLEELYNSYMTQNENVLILAESQHRSMLTESKEKYRDVLGEIPWYSNLGAVQQKHNAAENAALEMYDDQKKMGGEDIFQKFRRQLLEELEDIIKPYIEKAKIVEVVTIVGTAVVMTLLAPIGL